MWLARSITVFVLGSFSHCVSASESLADLAEQLLGHALSLAIEYEYEYRFTEYEYDSLTHRPPTLFALEIRRYDLVHDTDDAAVP